MRNKFLVLRFVLRVVLAALPVAGAAQEVVYPLRCNYALLGEDAPNRSGSRAPNDTLPFVDDFSRAEKYPDSDKWMDNHCFVNTTYPINPPTIGVATFEGLRADGTPQAPGSSYGSSDSLTSIPLKLGGLTAGDNVYLSFFYEAGGHGNAPESNDSLVLEFLRSDTMWVHIWGISRDSLTLDSFYRHDLHISDPQFLFDGFQFRFRNYADKRGNNDHWHLDYVKLDKNRVAGDALNDVAFTQGGLSLLKRYEAMPLDHFKGFQASELRDTLVIRMRNNFTVNKNVNYRYEAYEDCNDTPFHALNIGVIGNFIAASDSALREPNYQAEITNLTNTVSCDSLVITTRYIQDSLPTDVNRHNDTMLHHQAFTNCFAYDDGSAEQAYGVIGTGAMVSYKFHANKADTIRAVRIHFAHIDDDPSAFLFSVIVWDSIDLAPGAPGDHILYRQDFQTPEFVDTLNGFYTYVLDTPKVVSGNFWVGWQQGQSNNLGIGYDVNHDAGQYTYYNLFGNWSPSVLHGAMMIRPVLGKELPAGTGEPGITGQVVSVFPNPVPDVLRFRCDMVVDRIIITNSIGQGVLSQRVDHNSVDVSFLRDGIYFIQFLDTHKQQIGWARFVKMNP